MQGHLYRPKSQSEIELRNPDSKATYSKRSLELYDKRRLCDGIWNHSLRNVETLTSSTESHERRTTSRTERQHPTARLDRRNEDNTN
jgi:hypothetical protein